MSRTIEDYINEIFDEREVNFETRKKLWQHYNSTLSQGIDKASKNSVDITVDTEDLTALLKKDIEKFSAFKEDHFNKALLDLIEKNSKLPTRKEFMLEAGKVSNLYNKEWLNTELDLTIGKAQSALQWKDYEGRVSLYPNVRYIAIHDGRTRALHLSFDGLVLPFHHSFWVSHLPPWEYGCRCTTEQTDDEVFVPSGVDLNIQAKPGVGGNSAMTTKVFEDNHPYYQIGGGSINDVEKRLEQFVDEKDYDLLRSNVGWENAYNAVKRTKLNELMPNMALEELATVHDYTGTGYFGLNKNLFAGKTSEYLAANERILNKALSKMPVSKHEILFRGVKYDEAVFKQYADKIGKTIEHGGFTSTSSNYEIANGFGSSGSKMMFNISHKSGRVVGEVSAFSETFGSKSEFEVLFKSKTKFMVKGIEKIGNDYEIYLEEI